MMMTLAVVVGIMMVVYTFLLTIQQSLPPLWSTSPLDC